MSSEPVSRRISQAFPACAAAVFAARADVVPFIVGARLREIRPDDHGLYTP
jgi:hypothetical protein